MGVLFRSARRVMFSSLVACLIGCLWLVIHPRSSLGGSPTTPVVTPTAGTAAATAAANAAAIISLGQNLFNDVNLSNPPGQSCATCHGQYTGFTFPLQKINIQAGEAPGAVKGRFMNRIPPTINYAVYLPKGPPTYVAALGAFAGGLFWDGRANALADQALQPFQNPNEMNDLVHNVGSPALVVQKLQDGYNAYQFRQVYGSAVFSQSTTAVFNLMAQSIAAFESTPAMSPFSSKFDLYVHGGGKLSNQEYDGLRLVTGSTTGRPGGPAFTKNAQCFLCHSIPSIPGSGIDIWTNSCYANIGIPRNPANPYYTETDSGSNPVGYNPQGSAFIDLGLGGIYYPTLKLPAGNIGKGSNGKGDYLAINGTFKAPTLRNIDKRPMPSFVKAYMHNGFFKDLKTVVHFYNTRNLTTYSGEVIDFTQTNPYAHLKGTPLWPAPEFPSAITLQNPNGALGSSSAQVGNLGLTSAEEDDIVAFLKTLTDGYGPSYVGDQPPAQN